MSGIRTRAIEIVSVFDMEFRSEKDIAKSANFVGRIILSVPGAIYDNRIDRNFIKTPYAFKLQISNPDWSNFRPMFI
jgi:hypothetical protein